MNESTKDAITNVAAAICILGVALTVSKCDTERQKYKAIENSNYTIVCKEVKNIQAKNNTVLKCIKADDND